MDPSRIYSSKGDADAAASPAVVSTSSSSRSAFRKFTGDDHCSYWSIARMQCEDGQCESVQQRFRQCEGRPREQAVVDLATKQEQWVPAASTTSTENMFGDVSALLPHSLREIGGATDELISEVVPELQRLQRQMSEHPWRTLGSGIQIVQDSLHAPGSKSVTKRTLDADDDDNNSIPAITRSVTGWFSKLTGGATSGADKAKRDE